MRKGLPAYFLAEVDAAQVALVEAMQDPSAAIPIEAPGADGPARVDRVRSQLGRLGEL